jgi:hypothetical protein
MEYLLFVDISIMIEAFPWLLDNVGPLDVDWQLEDAPPKFKKIFIYFNKGEDVVAFKLKFGL